MEVNMKGMVVGKYSPISRMKIDWGVIEPRRVWRGIAHGHTVIIRRRGSSRFSVGSDAFGGHGPRVGSYPSKEAAIHYIEHALSDPHIERAQARSYVAPVFIKWRRTERGLYRGTPMIPYSPATGSSVVALEKKPNGWAISIAANVAWWRWYGDCHSDSKIASDACEAGLSVRFKSKKEACEAAEYAVRDILGHQSSRYSFENIPKHLVRLLSDMSGKREELRSLVGVAKSLGMCESMFMANVFVGAAQFGSPTVFECVDVAHELLTVLSDHSVDGVK